MPRVRKEPDDRFVMMREEDRSFWSRTAYLGEKYKLLVWLGALFLLAVGFDFRFPGQTMKAMQIQIDTLKIQVAGVDLLLRLRCLEQKPEDETKYQAVGINCKKILNR